MYKLLRLQVVLCIVVAYFHITHRRHFPRTQTLETFATTSAVHTYHQYWNLLPQNPHVWNWCPTLSTCIHWASDFLRFRSLCSWAVIFNITYICAVGKWCITFSTCSTLLGCVCCEQCTRWYQCVDLGSRFRHVCTGEVSFNISDKCAVAKWFWHFRRVCTGEVILDDSDVCVLKKVSPFRMCMQ